jgi:PAS domain S-box-containing protein
MQDLLSLPAAGPLTSEPATLRLLLVEDDTVDRMALRRHVIFEKLPYHLTEVSTVAEARVRLGRGRFDAIIVDHGLPDGSGFDLFAEAGETPVVFVTGANDIGLAVKAVKAGAADYLVKDTGRHYLKLLPLTLGRAIHERQMQVELRAAQQQLQQVLDFLPAAAFAINPAGAITYYNRKAVDLWGRPPRSRESAAEFCASVRLFTPDGSPASAEACLQSVQAGESLKGKAMIVEPAGGRRYHVIVNANRLTQPDGRPGGAIVVWTDVTELRRLEHQQHALESQLHHARRLEAVGTLAGGMAHEFNNLLTSILGNLQLAELDIPEGHAAQPPLARSVESCRRARDLVGRMLTFSESARGKRETFFPARVIEDAAELLRTCLPESIRIRTELHRSPAISCDPGELRQALVQLGENAAQAMGDRGGTLELALDHAVPASALRQKHPAVEPRHTIRLTVRDNGPGMGAETLARLFEPFHTTRGPGGTGLGLAGIYGIMKRQRGAVAVESAPGAGTTVHLFFPEADADPAGSRAS